MHAFQPKTGHLFGFYYPKKNSVTTNSPLLTLAIPNSVFHTIYVLEKEILQFLDLKPVAYNRERFQMASLWYIP